MRLSIHWPSNKVLRVLAQYTALAGLLTLLFSLLLFVTGLGGSGIQKQVKANVQASVAQFNSEGTYPNPLSSKDMSYRLDNFTDCIIMMQCLHMDTFSDPTSIYSNKYYSKNYSEDSNKSIILSLKETANSGKVNAKYVRYWIGIRALVRPLLTHYTYQQIRGIMAALMITLMIAAFLVIRKYTNLVMAFAFLLTMLLMNVPVICSCLQFMPCFLVGFCAIIALPWICKRRRMIVPFFFVVGASTMFMDFYTCPAITFAFPAVFLMVMMGGRLDKRFKLLICCLAAWGAGYGAFWIIKLGVSSIALGTNEFSQAFSAFGKWTGVSEDTRYDKFTKSYVFSLVFGLLYNRQNLLIVIVAGIAYAILVARSHIRGDHVLVKPDITLLFICMVPIVWIYFAARATGNHYWFQYRTMAAHTIGLYCFLASIFPSPHIEPVVELTDDERYELERAKYLEKLRRTKKLNDS